MGTKNSIWKEYIILGDIVNIRNVDGKLDKRELFPNIDDILLLENRITFLEDVYSKEMEVIENCEKDTNNLLFIPAVFLSALLLQRNLEGIGNVSLYLSTGLILSSTLVNYRLNKNNSQKIIDNSLAVSMFFENEVNKCKESIGELSKEKIDKSKIIKKEIIEVKEDINYEIGLIDRIDMFSNYGNIKKKLKAKTNKDKLDQYLDSIGCSDDDKLIFKELIGIENKKMETREFQYKRK